MAEWGNRPAATRAVARPAPAIIVLVGATLAMLVWTLNGDEWAGDVAVGLQISWPAAVAGMVLLGLTVVHFVFAAMALRSVSGRKLTMHSTAYAQLAAAATNRIIPNGIGGAGVNLRYLLRAGLHPGAAASALATLAVVGGLTDAAYASAVASAGPAVGVTGAAAEVRALTAHRLGAGAHPATWLLFAAVLALIAVTVVRRRRASPAAFASAVRQACTHAAMLARLPRRLVTVLVASAMTTAAMSAGFVVAVRVWGHAPTPLPAGALIAVYLLAATVGGATPLPSFVGVTEAALIGGLILSGYSSGSAITSVVVFRLITYWLPLPVGIAAARHLRSRALL
ncbi:MAG TPA: lysylphosphatidylglycerol synthase domain-containing protein [Solirubrobacteraceae bacterium]|nr:lysylphosphatidylglycerol synthase domain-containing protein [Solirubrobacteraceae bacterium]